MRLKTLAEPALKNSVLMNGYFLVEAIEEALGIFDARRRIPHDRAFPLSAFHKLNRVAVLALRVQRITRLPEKDRRKNHPK
jgi:hypothetical protein